MLPKLAELWKSQRILYFVATNHVALFDIAIIRSQRFDAIVFVPPPSFDRKKDRLTEIIRGVSGRETRLDVSAKDCEDAMGRLLEEPRGEVSVKGREDALGRPATVEADKDLPSESLLAKFILLRWDQLDELAYRLGVRTGEGTQPPLVIRPEGMSRALGDLADNKLMKLEPFLGYLRDRTLARRDFGKLKVWAVDGDLRSPPSRHFTKTRDGWWLFGVMEDVNELQIPGWRIVEQSPGEVSVLRDSAPNQDAADDRGNTEEQVRGER
jgi:hypothetical protein